MSICSGALSEQPLLPQLLREIAIARYTNGIQYHMHRTLRFLALLLISGLPARLPAQSQSPAPGPSVMHSAYGEKLRIAGIPNSGKINDHLYRGAQPRDTGLLELKKLGITTIVDLRDEDSAKSDWEEKRAESLGIRFVHLPVSGWSPPTNAQVAQFLSIFRDSPQAKVFVHCRYGEDRTGVFIASYRMTFEKLPPDQALKEMYYFGFNGFWHPSMVSFVRQFPARLNASPTFAAYKPKQ